MTIRTLIVDDEPLARERIRTLLEGESDIELVGECVDGPEALEAMRAASPDLVFLDVQMPEMDGFDVLAEMGDQRPPAVIFVTAYDRYALRAFEVHSLDYVLKPFDQERFMQALDRARKDLHRGRLGKRGERMLALLETMAERGHHRERLVVRTGGRVYFVRTDEITRVEAHSNYVMLHCNGAKHLLRETMKALEPKLDPKRFVRIHRSHIINLDKVRSMEPQSHGEFLVSLSDGTEIMSGRTYSTALHKLLEDES